MKTGRPPKSAAPPWWEAADWSLTNVQIAQQFGVSHNVVAQRRARTSAPPGPAKNRKRRGWEAVDWSQCNADIAAQMHIQARNVTRRRARHAPETLKMTGRRAAKNKL